MTPFFVVFSISLYSSFIFFFFLIHVHCKHKVIDCSSIVQKRPLNCEIFMDFYRALYPALFLVVIPERYGSPTVPMSYPSFLCRYLTYPRASWAVLDMCVYASESSP